jgi:hypothetical protein
MLLLAPKVVSLTQNEWYRGRFFRLMVACGCGAFFVSRREILFVNYQNKKGENNQWPRITKAH